MGLSSPMWVSLRAWRQLEHGMASGFCDKLLRLVVGLGIEERSRHPSYASEARIRGAPGQCGSPYPDLPDDEANRGGDELDLIPEASAG